MPIKVHPSVDPRKAKEPDTLARALQLHQNGQLDEAAALYTYLDEKYKPHHHARYLAAMICRDAGLYDEGIALLREVCLAKPKWAEAWYNYGCMLQETGRIADAEAQYRKALRCDPDFVSAYVNLGNVHLAFGRIDDAKQAWQRAKDLKPDGGEAIFNLAHALLLTGEWAEGWKAYEYRWSTPGFAPRNAYRGHASGDWHGEDLNGQPLTLFAEQGAGDTLMMLRYRDAILARNAGPLTWIVQPALVRLVRAMFPGDTVRSDKDEYPPAALVCPLMSLPHHLETTAHTVPHGAGYIALGELTGGVGDDAGHNASVARRALLGGIAAAQE